MSAKYEQVKKYYDHKLWTKKQVYNAVAKAWITAEEYKLITGETYKQVIRRHNMRKLLLCFIVCSHPIEINIQKNHVLLNVHLTVQEHSNVIT